MRVSLRWLRELLPEIPNNAKAVAEALTSIGLAVDAVHDLGEGLRNVQVVQVRSIARHPRRDQLRLSRRRSRRGQSAASCLRRI